jgi:hypothetical protein
MPGTGPLPPVVTLGPMRLRGSGPAARSRDVDGCLRYGTVRGEATTQA